jgi:hypothetical protein
VKTHRFDEETLDFAESGNKRLRSAEPWPRRADYLKTTTKDHEPHLQVKERLVLRGGLDRQAAVPRQRSSERTRNHDRG